MCKVPEVHEDSILVRGKAVWLTMDGSGRERRKVGVQELVMGTITARGLRYFHTSAIVTVSTGTALRFPS